MARTDRVRALETIGDIKKDKIYKVLGRDSFDYKIQTWFTEASRDWVRKTRFTKDLAVPKKINIKGFNCIYTNIGEDKVIIKYDGFKWEANFFGNLETYIKTNEDLIFTFFLSKIDIEVDKIMEGFNTLIEMQLEKLDRFILPNTKELHVAKAFWIVSEFAEKVADKFEDKSLVTRVTNIFNKFN